jgi:signal transduction histidine kinase
MRQRIVLLVVAMTTLVVLAFAIPLAVLVRSRVYDAAVKSMTDESRDITYFLQSSTNPPSAASIAAHLATLDPGRSASVQTDGGPLTGKPPPGSPSELPPVRPGRPGDPDQDHGPDGPQLQTSSWRGGQLIQQPVPTRSRAFYIVRLWASDDELHSGETKWWWLLVGTSVGLLAIGVVAAELLTRRIVRPLVRTAATAQELARGDVTARAPTTGPREVAAVGESLNRLADRIDELIAEERETVADLSHRLRTPMTALRLDAESLNDPAESERVGAHVSTLERMLTAIIHAARRPQREGRMPACDATAVLGERVAFWSALTEEQGRVATVSLPSGPLPVRCSAEDLATAVDALLENVVAHTPEGTAFAVSLVSSPPGAVLTVGDDGPGLSADASVRGRSDRGSTGLGLDIARRCAEASGGSIEFGAASTGGAQVTLRLGAP